MRIEAARWRSLCFVALRARVRERSPGLGSDYSTWLERREDGTNCDVPFEQDVDQDRYRTRR